MDSAESCPCFCPMNDAIINFSDLLDSSELCAEMIKLKKFFILKGKMANIDFSPCTAL
jgi:hypothetical protein